MPSLEAHASSTAGYASGGAAGGCLRHTLVSLGAARHSASTPARAPRLRGSKAWGLPARRACRRHPLGTAPMHTLRAGGMSLKGGHETQRSVQCKRKRQVELRTELTMWMGSSRYATVVSCRTTPLILETADTVVEAKGVPPPVHLRKKGVHEYISAWTMRQSIETTGGVAAPAELERVR